MEQISDNMQKYANYREQMGRLKKAIDNQFYLESIFIVYAIMEDRLESILRHSGKWNPQPGSFVSIDAKRKKVAKLAEEKNSLAHKYFSVALTDDIEAWSRNRNQLIHALMKQSLHTEDLCTLAMQGQDLAKILCAKTTLYNRALERKTKKEAK